MLRWLVIWLAISGGAGVMADESGESGEANKAGEVGEAAAAALDPIATLMQSLPDETIKKLRSKPAKFIETSADLIYGYGTDGGIDLGGIDNFIAVRRSAIRARAVAKLLEADLDNDGTVTLREVDILAATQAARGRGALQLAHLRADLDGDRRVSPPELRQAADHAAQSDLSDQEAEVLRAFITFDLSGDGKVTLEEVKQAVAGLQNQA